LTLNNQGGITEITTQEDTEITATFQSSKETTIPSPTTIQPSSTYHQPDLDTTYQPVTETTYQTISETTYQLFSETTNQPDSATTSHQPDSDTTYQPVSETTYQLVPMSTNQPVLEETYTETTSYQQVSETTSHQPVSETLSTSHQSAYTTDPLPVIWTTLFGSSFTTEPSLNNTLTNLSQAFIPTATTPTTNANHGSIWEPVPNSTNSTDGLLTTINVQNLTESATTEASVIPSNFTDTFAGFKQSNSTQTLGTTANQTHKTLPTTTFPPPTRTTPSTAAEVEKLVCTCNLLSMKKSVV
jgi:hypothetical protein